jgi:hypothetical protein
MERIDPETYSSIVNAKSEKQAKQNNSDASAPVAIDYTRMPNYTIGICIGYISKEIETKGAASVDARYMKYLKSKNKVVADVINTQKNHS